MATFAVGWLGLPAVAWAQSGGFGFNAIPQFPQTATVGAADVAASLRMENRSTEEYAFDTFRLTEITVVPNCGSKASAEICEPGARDPGVLVPSATGTGRNAPTPALGGNGCANVTFTITLLTPSDRTDEGRYLFEPVVPAYVGPTDTASSICTIDFTFHAARAPSIDSDPAQTTPGPLQTDQKARVRGTDVTAARTWVRTAPAQVLTR